MKTGWRLTALGKHLREGFGSAEHQRHYWLLTTMPRRILWQLADLIAVWRCKSFVAEVT
jgi:hypothetical protein